uniref:PRA1 family protein n=1 Tax=Kalanchoe fedtschenkoi TaxID=63787 RepID=A0A7N0TW35_KALFE
MTSYGTIPTSSSSAPPTSTNLEFISRAKDRIKSGLGARRPWKVLFNHRALGLPPNLSTALSRIRTNLAYFRMNYAIIVLLILFLSLLWHPISLIVLAAMMALWLFLYFLRDEPQVLFRRTIDDRVVLVVLSILTIVLLLLTKATWNIVGAVLIGAAVVLLHAALRKTDDLFLDEEEVSAFAAEAGTSSYAASG